MNILYTPIEYMIKHKMNTDKISIQKRLNRIEGQVRGINKMIEDERYCIDILQQMQAIKSALAKVEDAILKDHAASCVEGAITSGNATEQRKKFSELVDLFGKVKK